MGKNQDAGRARFDAPLENHTLRRTPHLHHIVVFNRLDLYHRSPDSGELQYKSREVEKTIRSHSDSWMCGFEAPTQNHAPRVAPSAIRV